MNARPGDGDLVATAAVFVTRDLKAAVDWYARALGFGCAIDWSANPTFAIVKREGAAIMLKQAREASAPLRRLTPGLMLFDAYVWVRDIEKVRESLETAETPIVEGPVRRVYGCTEIIVEDPENRLIAFGYCP